MYLKFSIIKWLASLYGYLKNTNILVLLFIFAELTRVVGFLPFISGALFYGIIIIYALHCLINTKSFEPIYLVLILFIPIQILITSPNSMFSPWQRYFIFALIIVTSSGFCRSETLREERNRIFEIICFSCAFIGVGSFFARFLGINFMMIYSDATDLSRAGVFGGLASHSMLLGPVAGVGTIYTINKFFKNKNLLILFCSIMCMASVLFATSRSGFISTIVAILVYLCLKASNFAKLFNYLVVIFIALACTMPLWEGAMSGLREKQNRNVYAGSTFSSRDDKWNQRLEEFKSSPVLGYGFVSVDPANKDNSIGGGGESLEPGSSWLSVLSMTGFIGCVLIGSIYVLAIAAVYKNSRKPLLLSILVLLSINMFTEGYIFFGGSFLCFMFWITVGVCGDCKYQPQISHYNYC